MENLAKTKYLEVRKTSSLIESGLFVKSCQPWLCASPDGIVKESDGVMLTLEVKCPSSCKGKKISVPYLDESGLKRNHEYYCQVQIQMYCANVSKCHFFVFSEVDSVLVEIMRDDVFL